VPLQPWPSTRSAATALAVYAPCRRRRLGRPCAARDLQLDKALCGVVRRQENGSCRVRAYVVGAEGEVSSTPAIRHSSTRVVVYTVGVWEQKGRCRVAAPLGLSDVN
jgi:hypothetical protein